MSRRLAVAIVLAFGLLAGYYSVVTPPWEAPDEVGHFGYVAHLVTARRLPVQRVGDLGEAHQPPLYYLIAAVAALPADFGNPAGAFRPNPRFMWAGQGGSEVAASLHTTAETFPFHGQALALHLARGVSVLMGMVTVALTIAIGWTIFPSRPSVGLLAAALVAFTPEFLFISGAVNNDNLLTMAATGAWWQLLRIQQRPKQGRQWLALGIWAGGAILAKLNGVVVAGVIALVLLAAALHQRSARLFGVGALAVVAPIALLTAPWLARNQALYGDPFGWGTYRQVFAVNLRDAPLQWGDLVDFFSTQLRSFWGVFGWMNVPAPWWLYLGGLLVSAMGLLGLGRFAVEGGVHALSTFQKTALAWLCLAVLAQEAYLLGVITQCNASCYQGRYLFPVIAPLAVLASVGWMALLPKGVAAPSLAGLVCLLFGLAALAPFLVIGPAYRIVPLPKSSLLFLPVKTTHTFGQTFALRGYRLDQSSDRARISLTLYWQALGQPDFDYSVFVHLIDEANAIIAQNDHAPGASAGYTPSAWWPGDVVADEHVVEIPPQARPGTYRLRVGVYNWATGQQLPVRSGGEPAGTFIILDQAIQR